MNNALDNPLAAYEAVARLLEVAMQRSGQSRRVADFLLAWHNATENGGWDPTDLWNVDEQIATDMVTVLRFLVDEHKYPDGIGFQKEITAVWDQWRASQETLEEA